MRAAQERVAQHGLHDLDLRRLAKTAKTSTSSFHRVFGSQETLLTEVFNAGWNVLDLKMSDRMMALYGGAGIQPAVTAPDFVEAILNGVLDALETDRSGVSATIIVGLNTIGDPIRTRLRETPGYRRFKLLAGYLKRSLDAQLSPEKAEVALEALFGVVMRQIYLLTPMCERPDAPAFDRKPFLAVVRQMVSGLLVDPTVALSVASSQSTRSTSSADTVESSTEQKGGEVDAPKERQAESRHAARQVRRKRRRTR